jgi:two-component system phosphate regulon sensor histidine kinase PhoR
LNEGQTRLTESENRRSALEVRVRRCSAEAERALSILHSLAEPVLVVDEYDELVLSNASARRLFGWSDEATVRPNLRRAQGGIPLADLAADVRRRKSSGPKTLECELADPPSGTRWFGAWAAPLAMDKSPSGSGHVLVVLRDVSQQKTVQRRHAEFISAASHEMKAPLAGITAYVELLADGDADDAATREEFLGVIGTQAERLRRLVENLLNLSRIEAGVVQVRKQTVSLNELLDEALHVVRPAAEQKRIALHAELSSLYLAAAVDRDQMLQAAINLLSNAIKYTHPEGRVTLRSRLADQEVEFEVEDTGVGLSEEDQTRVFERFYRVAKDRDMAPGTGLGLPLVKHIVEDVHGGRLAVRSQLGVGSTFAVSLPHAKQLS